MPFTRNISSFTLSAETDELVRTYCQLVAIELALKHSGVPGIGYGGHDLPTFLQTLVLTINSGTYPSVTSSLNMYVTRLSNDIQKLKCIYKDGSVRAVSNASYPNMRYTRREGDWEGISETSDSDITTLLQTTTEIVNFLRSNTIATGVSI